MKKLELVEKELKETITLNEIDCNKHLVILKNKNYNAVLRGNNNEGWDFVFADGSSETYSTIQKCFEYEVTDTDEILIYEL